jgi:hypothetical protein
VEGTNHGAKISCVISKDTFFFKKSFQSQMQVVEIGVFLVNKRF